jgi:para-aminobenzoate synthetase / 4-amino-4-deoxychorismate lyase
MPQSRGPDLSQGVFETLLVLDGEPVELGAHLDRLASSLHTLYGKPPPAGIEGLAREDAADLDTGRLRLTVVPNGDRLQCGAAAEAIDPRIPSLDREAGIALQSFSLPGGLGAHKWCDRSRLPAGAAGAVPLLLDRDDEVLEAGWANVFVVRDGVLATPPLDGRILPGVTRAAAIDVALRAGIEVAQRRLTQEDLLGAEEVFLTSSVRRVEAARELDGAALGGTGEIGAALGEALLAGADRDGAQSRRDPVGAFDEVA